MSDARHDWQEALAPSPECIDVARVGEELDAQSLRHVESCVRCQTELALFTEISRGESTPEETRDVQWIAAELQRKSQHSANVVPFRPNAFRALYSIAAALLIVVGAGYWMQTREPSIDAPIAQDLYRGGRVELVTPLGELDTPPNELRWTPVPNASRYRVGIAEVDGTVVWSSDTSQPHVSLPPIVVAQFAPGKSLLWEVKAFRGTEMLASSETQSVRVSVKPPRNTP